MINICKEINNKERKALKLRGIIYLALIILAGIAGLIIFGFLSGLGNAFVNKILFSQ